MGASLRGEKALSSTYNSSVAKHTDILGIYEYSPNQISEP